MTPADQPTDSASDSPPTASARSDYVPPPLPPARANLAHIVIPGTALWFAAFLVLVFFIDDLRAHNSMIIFWTCLAGWVLGLMGLAIYAWQRLAARRGNRGASRMALDEQF